MTYALGAKRLSRTSKPLIVGMDLTDRGFWSAGLDLVARSLEAAEHAAEEATGGGS